MTTLRLKVDPDHLDAPASRAALEQAASILRSGGLVALPTETVYGLGANALNADAVRKIFALKGRPATSPLIVHVDSIDMAKSIVREWSDEADRLARRYWPGPLTLVIDKDPRIPDEVTAGLPSVGVRIPNHPIALALIHEAGVPVAAPSANRFTELSPTTAEHVRRSFPDLMVIDGGPTQVGIESTVVSLTGPEPVVLRPGMVTIDTIRQNPTLSTLDTDVAHPSPGMHKRHYSPRTPLYLLDEGESTPTAGRGVYLSRADMPGHPANYAAILYRKLHELDREGLDWIAIERPPDTPAWSAIIDRLERAATKFC